MVTWILSGIILVLFSIVIYLSVRADKKRRDFSQEEEEVMSRLHQREIDGLQEIERKIQEKKDKAHQEELDLENYRTTQKGQIEQELIIYKEQTLSKLKQELFTLEVNEKIRINQELCNHKEAVAQKIQELEESVQIIQEHLNELKQKRDNTLAIIKEEEKLKTENDFFRIILKKEDVEDIEQLRSIEKRLNNKDILRKLIYKTFIEVPMNALFGRVGIKEAPGVYKITNLKNNMVYIGQSTNVKNRVKAHIQASIGISTIASQVVHDAMADEGLENFTFQLVEECSKEQLNDREKYYIDYYDSNHYGYNRTGGGART
jgi:hypothetical protein